MPVFPEHGLNDMSLTEKEKYLPIRLKKRGTDLRPAGSIWDAASLKIFLRKKLKRHILFPNFATNAKSLPVSRYVLWARLIRMQTGWCWWTGSGASAAATVSWPARTV